LVGGVYSLDVSRVHGLNQKCTHTENHHLCSSEGTGIG
jgi:hypothetical protein